MDEYGEPTLSSLLKVTNLGSKIDEPKLLKILNEQIGGIHKTGRTKMYLNNNENYRILVQRAIQFNTQSDFRDNYVASVDKIEDSKYIMFQRLSPFERGLWEIDVIVLSSEGKYRVIIELNQRPTKVNKRKEIIGFPFGD